MGEAEKPVVPESHDEVRERQRLLDWLLAVEKDVVSSYIRQSTNKDIRAVVIVRVVFGCVQFGNKND